MSARRQEAKLARAKALQAFEEAETKLHEARFEADTARSNFMYAERVQTERVQALLAASDELSKLVAGELPF